MSEQKMETQEMKIFDKYDASSIEVKDIAMKPYMNVETKLLLKSQGRRNSVGSGGITKVNVIERLANRVAVPGHMGKRHRIITGHASGKYNKNMNIVLKTFEIIAEKTKKNPVQVLVDAIENGSPRDEITVIEMGGARYPQAVDTSPIRRVSLAIRWMVQGSYSRCFGKKKKMHESLANEIMLAADGNMESFAMNKKNDTEKQADSAR
jgi:small subunit ribosomal protein S7